MKPQTLIIPLSRPKPKPDIPDADADYWLTALPKHQTYAEATNVTEMIAVMKRPSLIRRALQSVRSLIAAARALCRDCHPGDSIISRQPSCERMRIDAINVMLR